MFWGKIRLNYFSFDVFITVFVQLSGVELDEGTQCTPQAVGATKNVHLSTAIVDVDSLPANSRNHTQVWAAKDGNHHLLAHLTRENPHCFLDCGFSQQQTLTLFVKGPGNVHINGYYVEQKR